jgi:hypothetical protein
MPSISTALFWSIGSIIAGYLILSELLDVVGRLDLIEQKWPRVGKLLNNRPVRLALILFLLVAVWKDLSEHNEEAKPAPLAVQIAGPAAPKIDEYEREIATLNNQVADLKKSQSTGARYKPPKPAEPSGPNNAQLADSAKDIARRFRSLQEDLNWHDKNERETHSNGANGPIPPGFYNSQIQRIQPIRTEAIALQHQILNRLPQQPDNSAVDTVLGSGMISGINPLYDVANYFDQLAQQLLLK